jgi:hypothetical protein
MANLFSPNWKEPALCQSGGHIGGIAPPEVESIGPRVAIEDSGKLRAVSAKNDADLIMYRKKSLCLLGGNRPINVSRFRVGLCNPLIRLLKPLCAQ